MKNEQFTVQKYVADEGKVFDWADLDAHKTIDENNNEIINHLNAKVLFLSVNDSIDNYVEIAE